LRTSAAEERHVAALAVVPQNTMAVSAKAMILVIVDSRRLTALGSIA
jgi:hypothetical protein